MYLTTAVLIHKLAVTSYGCNLFGCIARYLVDAVSITQLVYAVIWHINAIRERRYLHHSLRFCLTACVLTA